MSLIFLTKLLLECLTHFGLNQLTATILGSPFATILRIPFWVKPSVSQDLHLLFRLTPHLDGTVLPEKECNERFFENYWA